MKPDFSETSQPAVDELRALIAALAPIAEDAPSSAELVREERDRRQTIRAPHLVDLEERLIRIEAKLDGER